MIPAFTETVLICDSWLEAQDEYALSPFATGANDFYVDSGLMR